MKKEMKRSDLKINLTKIITPTSKLNIYHSSPITYSSESQSNYVVCTCRNRASLAMAVTSSVNCEFGYYAYINLIRVPIIVNLFDKSGSVVNVFSY